MGLHIDISRVVTVPPDLEEELLPASIDEGFKSVRWLRHDWAEGDNRFSEPGEAFYVARMGGRLVGVCGVNRDPFVDDARVCRLRRLYVLPQSRRMGVGRRLVLRAVEDAGTQFSAIRLRTFDSESAKFFEALGFTEVERGEGATHVKVIDGGP